MALDNCRIGLEIFDLLPQWPISCIKIDGSIVRKLGANPSTNSLIQAMVQRATNCGIESVAEQVESHLVCNTVISAGLDYAQGFQKHPSRLPSCLSVLLSRLGSNRHVGQGAPASPNADLA